MSLDIDKLSIVCVYDGVDKHRCGYCKNPIGSVSHGMIAEALTAEDYQSLIDRGWRRSGQYVYKPVLNETCCPQYTIKCGALDLSLTKSQKRVIKKFNRFLATGELTKSYYGGQDEAASMTNYIPDRMNTANPLNHKDIESMLEGDKSSRSLQTTRKPSEVEHNSSASGSGCTEQEEMLVQKSGCLKQKVPFREGLGVDPDRPQCKKAKILRLERKREKLQQQGKEINLEKRVDKNKAKSLEEFLTGFPANCKHKLELKLIATSEPGDDWRQTEKTEYELYKRYQTVVHNDKDCSLDGFRRFLVNSPLKPTTFPNNQKMLGYGSYHQQYWLGDKLVAVGVIDILPKCISSVYFFYDPDYRNLTLGTYGSLRELQFTKDIHGIKPSIQYYYMGYYIHSCPKMRYKGRLVSSYLLCPETYTWVPIEKCIPKLDISKYSRLNEDTNVIDGDKCTTKDIDQMKVIINYVCMFYRMYKNKYGSDSSVESIGALVGKKCSQQMLFAIQK